MESRNNDGRGLLRGIVIPLLFVAAGLAVGYLIATVLDVSGGARVLFALMGILIAGGVAKWLGLLPEGSTLKK